MKLITDNYTFPLGIEEIYGVKEAIYVGNPRNRPYPCVTIHIHYDDNDATLSDVKYASTCSTNKHMDQTTGTVEIIMAALRFTIDRHTDIEKIILADESYIPTPDGNIEVTARRLLTGKPGWYEEYLGAIPYGDDTENLINKIRTENIIVSDDHDYKWWNSTNANRVAHKLLGRSIIGTSWYIPRNTILNYPINIRLEQDGGSYKNKSGLHLFKKWNQDTTIRRRTHKL